MEHTPAGARHEPAFGAGEAGVGLGERAGDLERDVDASLLDSIEERLADVERALARLDEGTYGTCEVCGATIDDTVLADAPATRFCPEHLPFGPG